MENQLKEEEILSFIYAFVNSNESVSITEDNDYSSGNLTGCHKISIATKSGVVLYDGIGLSTSSNARLDALNHIYAKMMQRLTVNMCGFISLSESGSININYDERSISVISHDSSSKTITATFVSK
jgi:hypothetical protein